MGDTKRVLQHQIFNISLFSNLQISYFYSKTMVGLWQRVYGVGLRRPPMGSLQSKLNRPECRPKNAAAILKPLVPNPHLTPFTHGAS